MTCPRPDGTYAPWCTNIPTTTTSTSTTTSTTTLPTTTTTTPVVPTTTPQVTTVTTVPPPAPELPRTGSDAVPLGLLGVALIAVGVVTTLRTRAAT